MKVLTSRHCGDTNATSNDFSHYGMTALSIPTKLANDAISSTHVQLKCVFDQYTSVSMYIMSSKGIQQLQRVTHTYVPIGVSYTHDIRSTGNTDPPHLAKPTHLLSPCWSLKMRVLTTGPKGARRCSMSYGSSEPMAQTGKRKHSTKHTHTEDRKLLMALLNYHWYSTHMQCVRSLYLTYYNS